MIKNTAGQKIGAQMISASDGSAFTGAVTVSVTGDAGTQAAGSVGAGACAHEGNGYHTYAPSQAETNYDLIAFTFTGTGAIPVTIQVFTAAGDAFTRLGTPAGASVSADIAAVAGAVWNETRAAHVTAGTFGQGVASVIGNVGGNVVGSVASVTAPVTAGTVSDKTGYAIGVGGIGATAFAAGAINAAALNADAVDEILDEAIGDGSITMRQALKIVVGTLAGKVSGAGSATITIRNLADTTDLVVASVDGAGNRTLTTVNV